MVVSHFKLGGISLDYDVLIPAVKWIAMEVNSLRIIGIMVTRLIINAVTSYTGKGTKQ